MLNSGPKTNQNPPTFNTYFSSLKDPRRTSKGNYFYPFEEILFLSIASVISGADGWIGISQFGRTKLDWLRKYFPYKNGIPSHDVIGKLFARLNHKEFSKCFTSWIDSISSFTNGEVVAIDGKTICKSNDKSRGLPALHMVSAYAADSRLCLGQELVNSKSNEITAIPALLKVLDIKGCIVTIDAMGCQKDIAKNILKSNAEYLLMVKDNQKELRLQIENLFSRGKVLNAATQIDAGHGRVESRTCKVIDDLRFLDEKENWPGLRSVVEIKSERYDKQKEITTTENRYYISSMIADASKFNNAIRKHWTIENNLHWSLDVLFKEDASLKKQGNSAANYNIILKLALTMLEKEKTRKLSKPIKRLTAALDDQYRDKILKS